MKFKKITILTLITTALLGLTIFSIKKTGIKPKTMQTNAENTPSLIYTKWTLPNDPFIILEDEESTYYYSLDLLSGKELLILIDTDYYNQFVIESYGQDEENKELYFYKWNDAENPILACKKENNQITWINQKYKNFIIQKCINNTINNNQTFFANNLIQIGCTYQEMPTSLNHTSWKLNNLIVYTYNDGYYYNTHTIQIDLTTNNAISIQDIDIKTDGIYYNNQNNTEIKAYNAYGLINYSTFNAKYTIFDNLLKQIYIDITPFATYTDDIFFFWANGTYENYIVPNITNEVIDVRNLMLQILTMPFSFINQAFDVTLWPGTQYSFNFSNFIKGMLAIAALLFIIRLFTSGFSITGNYIDKGQTIAKNKAERQLIKAKTENTKARTNATKLQSRQKSKKNDKKEKIKYGSLKTSIHKSNTSNIISNVFSTRISIRI